MKSLQISIPDLQDPSSPTAYYTGHRYRSLAVVTLLVQFTDIALLLLPVLASCSLRPISDEFSVGELIVAGGCAAASGYAWLYQTGTYRVSCLFKTSPRLWMMLTGGTVTGALLLGISLKMLPSRELGSMVLCLDVSVWAGIALTSISLSRLAWCKVFSSWIATGGLQKRVIVISDKENAGASIEKMTRDPDSNLNVIGIHVWANLPVEDEAVDRLSLDQLVWRCRSNNIDTVILAMPLSQINRIESLRKALRSVIADVYIVPDLTALPGLDCGLKVIGQTPVVRIARRPLDEWQHLRKSCFDKMIAILLLVVLSPLLLIIGAIIQLESSGPALFRQSRIGFNNKVFTVYKFRTMYADNDDASISGSRQARRGDPRITPIGRWLRKHSVDELPQLLNVLRGEMSLVGPRPHPLNTGIEGGLFQDVVKDYAIRHRVLPGITGWAQINGCRGETLRLEQIERRVAFDLFYIENWSLFFDISILVRTVTTEILSSDAF